MEQKNEESEAVIIPKENTVIPNERNPLGIKDFDISKFELEEKKVVINNDDLTAGLRIKAERLREELDNTSNNLNEQLLDVRRMKKEVADTVLILKNYFGDLSRKEEVLNTTINTLGKRRSD